MLLLPSISTARGLQIGDAVTGTATGFIEEVSGNYAKLKGRKAQIALWGLQRITNAECRYLQIVPPVMPGVMVRYGRSRGMVLAVTGYTVIVQTGADTLHLSNAGLYPYHELPITRVKTIGKQGIAVNDAAYAGIV